MLSKAKALRINFALTEGTWEKILDTSSMDWGGANSMVEQRMESYGTEVTVMINPHSFILYRKIKG